MTTPALSVVIPTFNNVNVLRRCLASWRRFAPDAPVELIVIEDGCRDSTADVLRVEEATPWGRRMLRSVHEQNVHELRCTNRGFREARGSLLMTWQDDMFLSSTWLVPELIRTFDAYPDLGLLCMCRGLNWRTDPTPIRTWDDLVDWRRLESTIGRSPWNWLRLEEVDGVIRPWVVRRECVERVGLLDEAFIPTGWDESDLAFRIRQAGWRVATHGYERAHGFEHLGSSTLGKSGLNLDRDLQNGQLFHARWNAAIGEHEGRPRKKWWRRMSVPGAASAFMSMGRAFLSTGSGKEGTLDVS